MAKHGVEEHEDATASGSKNEALYVFCQQAWQFDTPGHPKGHHRRVLNGLLDHAEILTTSEVQAQLRRTSAIRLFAMAADSMYQISRAEAWDLKSCNIILSIAMNFVKIPILEARLVALKTLRGLMYSGSETEFLVCIVLPCLLDLVRGARQQLLSNNELLDQLLGALEASLLPLNNGKTILEARQGSRPVLRDILPIGFGKPRDELMLSTFMPRVVPLLFASECRQVVNTGMRVYSSMCASIHFGVRRICARQLESMAIAYRHISVHQLRTVIIRMAMDHDMVVRELTAERLENVVGLLLLADVGTGAPGFMKAFFEKDNGALFLNVVRLRAEFLIKLPAEKTSSD